MSPRPAVRCQDVQELAGPHDGCGEFTPAAPVRCADPATHLAKTTLPYRRLSLRLCRFHATVYATTHGFRTYRFREI
jgi:hypothetical protein